MENTTENDLCHQKLQRCAHTYIWCTHTHTHKNSRHLRNLSGTLKRVRLKTGKFHRLPFCREAKIKHA